MIKHLHILFICIFCNNYIHCSNFISLEYKYKKLQFDIRISSIEASQQTLRISNRVMSTTRLTAKKSERLLSQERLDTVYFPESIGVSVTIPSLRVTRYISRGIEICFLTELRMINSSLFFFPFFYTKPFNWKCSCCFYKDRAICWACADEIYGI